MPETILPPGEYWIGDPCYVISNDHWHDFIRAIDEDTGNADYEGHRAAVYHTQFGDGSYADNRGRTYGVDSGQLAAVPVSLIKAHGRNHHRLDELGRRMNTHAPIMCRDDGSGILRFGNLTINT